MLCLVSIVAVMIAVMVVTPLDPGRSEEEDPDLIKNTNELLALTEQEGGDKQSYRGSFEDHLGDIHDWQNDVVTHHYLCRQLYLHYNQSVRGGGDVMLVNFILCCCVPYMNIFTVWVV